jgi:predicted dienelactone hydrolase
MKIATAALASLLVIAATPAFSAGFQMVTIPDGDRPALEAGIWYPSDAPASPQPVASLRQQTVAPDGAIAVRKAPLIVVSHGSGGSFADHYDTAIALAEAGFVVVAVTHNGDSYRGQNRFTRLDRPRHIRAAIDYMLSAWPGHDVIDPERIGVYGFSAGGAAALVAIGGTLDALRVQSYCLEHPEDWACKKRKELALDLPDEPVTFVHDARIKAAVIAAPAIGYAFTAERLAPITVPIQLWRGDHDEILPHPRHAQNVYDNLPTKPEYHVVPNAGHFAFLAPCSPALAQVVPFICHDPDGFDRAAFHAEFNANVVAFFKARLPERQTARSNSVN